MTISPLAPGRFGAIRAGAMAIRQLQSRRPIRHPFTCNVALAQAEAIQSALVIAWVLLFSS